MNDEPLNAGGEDYERPNLPWQCGLASEGAPCPSGPSGSGKCPALGQCHPTQRNGRWFCNRAPQRGGPCTNEPLPDTHCIHIDTCEPAPRLRLQRGSFVTGATMLALGLLLLVFNAPFWSDFVKPGPLSQPHAQIIKTKHGSDRCATCHGAGVLSGLDWLAAAVVHPPNAPTQSSLCIECHKDAIPPDQALHAHSLPPETLQQVSVRNLDGDSELQLTAAPSRNQGDSSRRDNWACAACHKEHHGAMNDLTAMANDACQSCHQEQYHSFETDHPEFGNWPHERRTRIIFSHGTHEAKHFPTKNAEFACNQCHVENKDGTAQLTLSFESSCSSCHNSSLELSYAQGVPLLTLPMLDVASLSDAGLDIGDWPEDLQGDFDGELPTVMKLLLYAAPQAREAIDFLGYDFQFIDIDPGDLEHLQAAATIAKEMKQLFSELSHDAPATISNRFFAVTGSRPASETINRLCAGLQETLTKSTTEWLPDLLHETGNSGSGNDDNQVADTTPTVTKSLPDANFQAAGVWEADANYYAIEYHPTGHADGVLAALLELAGRRAPRSDDEAGESEVAVSSWLADLASSQANGQCATCHSQEEVDEEIIVNWRAYRPDRSYRPFTRFAHGPHTMLPELSNCKECHQFSSEQSQSDSYLTFTPQSFVSEFVPMSRQACATCHTRHGAGSQCTQCHNYHIRQ